MLIEQFSPMKKELAGALIGLAKACGHKKKTEHTDEILAEGLCMLSEKQETNLPAMVEKVHQEKMTVAPGCSTCAMPCGNTSDYDLNQLDRLPGEIQNLKGLLFLKTIELAQALYPFLKQGIKKEEETYYFYKALSVISYDFEVEELVDVIQEITAATKLI